MQGRDLNPRPPGYELEISNQELRGVFTVDWNQPAPDGSGRPLVPNEVVHALIQHFDEEDLSNKNVHPAIRRDEAERFVKRKNDRLQRFR